MAGQLTAACPRVDLTFKHVVSTQEAEAILAESPDVEGFVSWALGTGVRAPLVLMRSKKPVVMVDDLFGGTGVTLTSNPVVRRENLPTVGVFSSDIKDIADAVNLFPAIHAMKESNILDIVDYNIASGVAAAKDLFGVNIVQMKFDEFVPYYDKTGEREGSVWADYWTAQAKKVVEPTREDLVKSGRMYLALCRAMKDRKADAVSMDCLGGFYGGKITAYPCLSHFQMNNDGSTGVCEGDMFSTCTQLMMRYLTGRPGYVSDPVIDTSKDEIIYAHCVATSKVFGPKGKANPYIIRSHAEDGKGASVQSLMPVGEQVTTMKIDFHGKRMVIHSGKTTRNVDEPKACRTKLAAKTNAQAILDNWDMGWHRVTFYGDYRKQAMNLARLLGISVFEEDKES